MFEKLKERIDCAKEDFEFNIWWAKLKKEEERINQLRKENFMPYSERHRENKVVWYLDREECPNKKHREESDLFSYIVSEYIWDGLIFEYKVDGEFYHEHHWEDLLSKIMKYILEYDLEVTFDECEEYYSEQELRVLQAFVKKLKEDKHKGNFTINENLLNDD